MCSYLDFYSNSPDGVKMAIMALPSLTLVAVAWLVAWLLTRRKTVIRVVPLAEVKALIDQRSAGEQNDTSHKPRPNPREDREEE